MALPSLREIPSGQCERKVPLALCWPWSEWRVSKFMMLEDEVQDSLDPEKPRGFTLSILTLGLKNESLLGAGDMVSWLRSLVVFSEDLAMV